MNHTYNSDRLTAIAYALESSRNGNPIPEDAQDAILADLRTIAKQHLDQAIRQKVKGIDPDHPIPFDFPEEEKGIAYKLTITCKLDGDSEIHLDTKPIPAGALAESLSRHAGDLSEISSELATNVPKYALVAFPITISDRSSESANRHIVIRP